MSILQLITIGLQYGVVMAILLSLLFIGIALISPDAWVNDYPPDIRAKYGPMSEQARRWRKLAGIPFALILFGLIALAMRALFQESGGAIRFFDAFIVIFVMLFVFNLVDLLIIDWLIFVTIQPKIIVLPGTEGMSGYKDYGFHFRASLKGLVGSFLGSLALAAVAWLVATLLI
jgi:hypothetical protein